MKIHVLLLGIAGLGLLSAPHVYAQDSRAQEVYKILGISVEGNSVADPAAIIANSGLKVGDEFTIPGEQIGQAIRKLWSIHLFEDVQVAIERKIENGVFLVIKVKELPRYEKTVIEGRDEISEDDIMKKIDLVRGQVFPPQETIKIRNAVKALYEKEGYLLADVNVTTEPVDTSRNRIIVHININEGQEVQVEHIMFEGNKAFDDGDLRGAMDGTSEKVWWKFWSSAKFDRKKYTEDKKLIVAFYKNHGFRDAEVLSDSIWYSDDKKHMEILLRVNEGPQYKIRHIAWEGNTVYPVADLNERLGIAPGEVYNADKLEKNLRGNDSQTDVSSLYVDNGYLKVNLEPVETRVAEDSLDILIKVYEFNQFKIGHVNITGNTKTLDNVIRRELLTRPGDYFSRDKVIRSIRQLSTLNYFNPEKIKPDVIPQPDDKTVDLTYEVEEKSSDNINASVGYSGAFGFTGALGFTINNFSIADPLSGGAGQILNFEWQFGEASRFRTFTLGFTEPWMFGTPTLLGVTLFDTRENYTFDLEQLGGSVRVGRRFRWPDDYFRGDWILSVQNNNVRNGLGVYANGIYSQVSLTQIISRNSVNNPIFPTQGSNVSLSTEISGPPVLPGSIAYHKWMFNSEWYVPLFNSSRLALYFNSQYGLVQNFPGHTFVPPQDLFFMGGTGLGYIATTPLRGYEDQSIGPHNANGIASGGPAMTKQTVELRLAASINPIPIYFLLFAEGGNVYESLAKVDFFDLRRSAGFGMRIQIAPIGLIGFDYGYGFDHVLSPNGGPEGWHFHFVFGRGF